jgi:ribonuclease HI
MSENSLSIFTDGGSRGNPGPAACAFVATNRGVEIAKQSKYLGVLTNNLAEYEGVKLALNWVVDSYKNSGEIIFFLDSELVVKQLNGFYKVKNKNILRIFTEIKLLINKIPEKIIFKNIPRSENEIADSLLNEKLDIYSKTVR